MIQLVVLYRSEKWIMTLRIGRVWERSYHRVDRKLMARKPRKVHDRLWVYPSLEGVLEEAGLHDVDI